MGKIVRWTGPLIRVGLVIFISGCARNQAILREGAPTTIPTSYTLYQDSAPAPAKWWRTFNSPELDALVTAALADNFTIEQAAARVRAAGALLRQSTALRGPELDFGVDASVARRQSSGPGGESGLDSAASRLNALNRLLGATTGAGGGLLPAVQAVQEARSGAESLVQPSPSSRITTDTDSYGLSLTARYEVDIWGRLRAAESGASATFEATRDDALAVMQSIAGQVVLTWLDLLQYEQILEVVQGQLETNRTNLGLIELRYRNGLATSLDVYQQRQAVADTEAVIPPLEARRGLLQHTLAVLLGKAPPLKLELGDSAFRDPGPLPEAGIPADLLANRPDVRAAGLKLHAADWQVSAAQADRLPRLQLSARLGTDGDALGLLFDNWVAQLAASLTGPLFDSGRRSAVVDQARAEVDERLAAYKSTVVAAVAEVEDALLLLDRQEAYIQALHTQLQAAENAYREALGRYRRGLSDYLDVLTALRNQQSLERETVEANHDYLVYRVQLHLALGGGWMASALAPLEGSTP